MLLICSQTSGFWTVLCLLFVTPMSCCSCLCHLCGSAQIIPRKGPGVFLRNSAWLSWWWSDSFWINFKNKLRESIHETWLNRKWEALTRYSFPCLFQFRICSWKRKTINFSLGFTWWKKWRIPRWRNIYTLFTHRWNIQVLQPVFKISWSSILKAFPWFILLRQNLVMKINLSKYINVFQVILPANQASLRSPESYH